MRRALINIIENGTNARLGVGSVIDFTRGTPNVLYTFCTLELPYKGNEKRKSSIPLGKYSVRKRASEKYGNHFEILNVPNRDLILIHQANYVRELLGCIAVGSSHKDIDNDGVKDVINSKKTLKKLLELLPDNFELEIKA